MANRKSKKLRALVSAVLIVLTAVSYIAFGEELTAVLRTLNLDFINVSTLHAKPVARDELEVHVIDVGQGDSILIRSRDGIILIDAGTPESWNDLHVYLDAMNIRSIDYFICTHPHEDHIGSASMIVREFSVGTLLMPDALSEEYCFADLMQAVRERKVVSIIPAVGDAYTLGRMTFEILGSPEASDNLNNRSLIVRLTFGENSFLFMGDTEADIETYLLEQYGEAALDSDFIKVGHHGSNTSSSEDFIRAVSPAIAAISCGAGNEHGHPHREILERLTDLGTETILRTDQNGTFVVSSNGHELSVRT